MEIKNIWGAEEKSCRHTILNNAKAPISHAYISSVPSQRSKRPFWVLVRARRIPSLPCLQAAVQLPLFIPAPLLLFPHVVPCIPCKRGREGGSEAGSEWGRERGREREWERGRVASETMRREPINLLGAICRRLQSKSFQVGNIFVLFSCMRKSDYTVIASSWQFSFVLSCTPEKNVRRMNNEIIFDYYKL